MGQIKERQSTPTYVIYKSEVITSNVTSNIFDVQGFQSLRINVDCTSVSGTSPTFDMKIQLLIVDSWVDLPSGSIAQITATGAQTNLFDIRGIKYIRFQITVGGTSPSFTVDVSMGLD